MTGHSQTGLRSIRALNDRYPDHGLVTFGSADEHERSESLLKNWHGRKLNLCGKPSPRVSAAILKKADLFLGHDSGPMHLAANVGTPCVAVFSARVHPGIWYPRGEGHQAIYHKTECANCKLFVCTIQNKKCILSITIDEVVEAVGKVLSVASRSPDFSQCVFALTSVEHFERHQLCTLHQYTRHWANAAHRTRRLRSNCSM